MGPENIPVVTASSHPVQCMGTLSERRSYGCFPLKHIAYEKEIMEIAS